MVPLTTLNEGAQPAEPACANEDDDAVALENYRKWCDEAPEDEREFLAELDRRGDEQLIAMFAEDDRLRGTPV